MAVYQLVHPKAWSDDWFLSLPPQAKLLFLYLLTSPDTVASGIFECPIRKTAFSTGVPAKKVEAFFNDSPGHVEYDYDHSLVWVVSAAGYWLDNANVVKAMRKQIEMLNGHRFSSEFRQKYPSIWKPQRSKKEGA